MARKACRLLIACTLLALALGIALPAYAAEPEFDGDASSLTDDEWMRGISGDRLLSDIVLPGTASSANASVFCPSQSNSNNWHPEFVRTQDTYISKQLTDGARIFELHLTAQAPGIGWSGSKDSLWVAEKVGSNLYYAQDSNDNAVSLKKAINYMRSFLKKHPSETTVVVLSEADNTGAVFANLRRELDEYKNYLYLGSEMPALKNVRGKVVVCTTHPELLGQDGGMAFPARGATASTNIGGKQFSPYTLQSGTDAQNLRFTDVVPLRGDVHTTHSNIIYACKAVSAEGESTPWQHASEINPVLFGNGKKFSTRGTLYGWVLAGYLDYTQARQLWQANFPDGLEYSTAEFWTREPTTKKIFSTKVLSGSNLPAPIPTENAPAKYIKEWRAEDNKTYEIGQEIPITQDPTVLWATWTMSWASLAEWLSQQGGKTASIMLDRALVATPLDSTLVIPADANITINLNNLTLNRGLRWANQGSILGSVIQMEPGSALTLTDGEIRGGRALGVGGGICMSERSTLTLNNAYVHDNYASDGGAGIYVPQDATLKVLGNTSVSSNEQNLSGESSLASNVYLDEGVKINVDGALDDTWTKIGVTTSAKPTSGAPVVFTSGLSGKGSATNFTSDDTTYRVGMVDGEAVLTTGVEVHFDSMGGSSVPSQMAAEGMHLAEPTAPKKFDKSRRGIDELNGEYALRGWYLDEAYTQQWDFENSTVTAEMVANGLTLYAKWGVRYTFRTDEGSEPSYTSVDLDFGQKLSDIGKEPPIATNEGWELAGWAYFTSRSDNIGRLFKFEETPATTSLAFLGRWRRPRTDQYTVTFDACGGTPTPGAQTVTHGNTATEPTGNEAPTREGHTLEGWYTDPGYTNKWSFSSAVTSNMTLYAKWQAQTFTVTFVDEDGTTKLRDDQTVAYGSQATEPQTPTKEGCVFQGWYYQSGENTWDYYSFSRPVTAGLTLKAVWATRTYRVSFDAEGGMLAAGTTTQTVNHGSVVTQPANPTREGHRFLRWYINNPTDEYSFNSPVTADFTLHAAWQRECTVTFDANGGSMEPNESTRTVDYGSQIGALPGATKDGSKFCGWFDGGTLYDATTPVTKDVTLVAQWLENPKTYTITFDSKGGSAVPSQTVDQNGLVTKPSDPTYDHHVFSGWYAKGQTALYDFTSPVTSDLTLEAAWTPETHTVTFDTKCAAEVQAQTLAYGIAASEPQDPVREGYVFQYWYTDAVSTPYDFTTPVVADITLNAAWAKLHTVTFDSAGGSYVQPQTVVDGDVATQPSEPIYDGYHTFAGWYAEGADAPYDFSTAVTNDFTLTAHWTIDTYTVTFDTGEGGPSIPAQTVDHGSHVAKPTDPTKEGSVFSHWYTKGQNGATSPYDFATPITGNLTLYAAWIALPTTYTVFFDSDGGSAVDAQAVESGETATQPSDPTRDKYRFDGWFLGDATDPYDFSTPVTSDMTLKAHWTKTEDLSTYTVTFDTRGGTPVPGSQTKSYGAKVEAPQQAPTLAGYDFGGWFKDAACSIAWNFGTDTVTGDMTLYAKWTQKTFSVTFDAAGGSPAPAPQRISYGARATRPSDPTKEGFVFVGWHVKGQTGTDAYVFDTPITGNLTLEAMWVTRKYDVAFNAHGGTPEPDTQKVEHGSTATTPAQPTRDGYEFAGWYVNGEDEPYDFTKPVTSDLTIHASWLKQCTVTLDANGGTFDGTASRTVLYGNPVGDLPTPTKGDDQFCGWFFGGTLYDKDTPVTDDVTLTAKWVAKPADEFVVVFDSAGGSPVDTQTVKEGDVVAQPSDPTLEHWEFGGWYEDNRVNSYDFDTPVTGNLTLRALWMPENHEVSFVSGSTAVESYYIAYGIRATPPEDPVREGYAFRHWSLTADGPEFDFATPITADTRLVAVWTKLCTVTFDSAGGSAVEPQVVRQGDMATEPTAPTRGSLTFAGWYLDGSDTSYDFATPVNGNITLRARWNVTTYQVTFDTGDGDSEVPAQTVEAGACATRPANPTKEGHVFTYWHTDGSDVAYDFATPVTGNLTLHAAWATGINTYNVSFNTNGGTPTSIDTQTVAEGYRAVRPANPTRDGYEFVGWYELLPEGFITMDDLDKDRSSAEYYWAEDDNFYAPFSFGDPILDNTTLRARWKEATHTVTFNSNGGSPVSPVTRKHGEQLGVVPTPVRNGYEFNGWTWIDDDGETKFFSYFNPIEKDWTLTAYWLPYTPLTVDFDTNGGSPETIEQQKVDQSQYAQEPEPEPTRDGHEFDGWWVVLPEGYINREQAQVFIDDDPIYAESLRFDDERDGAILYRFNFDYPVESNLILRAQWKADICHVTYMSGDEVVDEQEIAWGTQTIPPQDPYRFGYTFEGWYADESLTESYDFESAVTSDLTLYAKFSPSSYTVSFDSAGGSTVGSQVVTHGAHAARPADPVWDGHIFLGWFEDTSDKPFDFAGVQIMGDLTLHARWNEVEPGTKPDPGEQTEPGQTFGVHTSITNTDGAPVVSQREGSFDATMQSMFAAEAATQDVYVTLSSSTLDQKTLDGREKSLLQAKLDELGAQAGSWFDLSIAKRLGSEQAEPAAVSTTSEALKLSVAIPEALRSDGAERTFYVLSIHDGVVSVHTKGTGERLDFESDRFSTYLLAYTGPAPKPATPSGTSSTTTAATSKNDTSRQSTARTGDPTSSAGLIAVLGIAAVVLGRRARRHLR